MLGSGINLVLSDISLAWGRGGPKLGKSPGNEVGAVSYNKLGFRDNVMYFCLALI